MSNHTWIARCVQELGGHPKGECSAMVCCPTHDDTCPSLSIGIGDDGTRLVHCFGGCQQEQVIDTLRERGLWPTDGCRPTAPARRRSKAKLGREVCAYDYLDADGTLLFQVVRFDPKDFRQRRPDGNGGWTWKMDGVRRVLYRLPELLAAHANATVFVCEGEKDCGTLTGLGLTATCNSGGAGKWHLTDDSPLAGRHVCILPDADDAGRKHALEVASALYGKAASVRILQLPGLLDKGDVSDWLSAGGTADALADLVAEAAEYVPTEPGGDGDGDEKLERGPSVATRLVRIAEGAELWHTRDGDAYATFPVGEHVEHWPVRSRVFKRWLTGRLYAEAWLTARTQTLEDALLAIEGRAIHEGKEHAVRVRLAEHDGAIYLDLADADWQCVEVTPTGWRVCPADRAPVRFRRARGMEALPIPVTGGDINELREFVNVPDDAQWTLVLAWAVAALRPTGPYPVLIVSGEQGSAKSTLCRMLRALIDPYEAPLRSQPREERDLVIASRNSWVVGFDNLSGVWPWLSDALCRIATGGGFATRQLYSDSDEVIFSGQRPIVANGIDDVATRPDLLDRAMLVTLPTIPEAKRRTEVELWRRFDDARPQMLGALLDAVSGAMRRLPAVRLGAIPRMADFATWAVAAEPDLGIEAGEFLREYSGNRAAAVETAIDASPIGAVVREFAASVGAWTGTATELLTALDARVSDGVRRSRGWPNSGRRISAELRRLTPSLRKVGVTVLFEKSATRARTRLIRLGCEGAANSPSTPSEPSTNPPGDAETPIALDDSGRCVDDGAGTYRPTQNVAGAIKNADSDDVDDVDDEIPALSHTDLDALNYMAQLAGDEDREGGGL